MDFAEAYYLGILAANPKSPTTADISPVSSLVRTRIFFQRKKNQLFADKQKAKSLKLFI